MKCPNCQSQNIQQARFCVNCGYSFTNVPKKNKGLWWLFSVVIVFCVVWTAAIFVYIQGQEEGNGGDSNIEKTVVQADQGPEEEQPVAAQPSQEKEEKVEHPSSEKTEGKEEKVKKADIIDHSLSKVYTVQTGEGIGSGFLYGESGMVVTNAHVVEGYSDVTLENSNGGEFPGKVVGISNEYDVALIAVDHVKGEKPLPIELEKSRIGMEVIALGSPAGLQNTGSIGYLTGVDRQFDDPEYTYENLYQIDAQVSPGSSGGPLLNAETGKVIGINSAILSKDQSIGFSIPLFTIVDMLDHWSQTPMTAAEVYEVFNDGQSYAAYDSIESYDSYDYEEPVEEYDSDEERSSSDDFFEESRLSDFIISFRNSYEDALDYEDFLYIDSFLKFDSEAYWDLSEYVEATIGQGMVFDFTSNEVTNMVIQEDYAIVSTYEVFDFMNAAGNWSVYERTKNYTVVVGEYGDYKISNIDIYE